MAPHVAGIAKIKTVRLVPNLCRMIPDGTHDKVAPKGIAATINPN
jgi:hypothetical protein